MKKLLLVCLAAAFLATPASGKPKKDIAMQLYSLRDDFKKDFSGALKATAQAGYAAVEAADFNNGLFYGLTPEAFRAAVEAEGMYVLSSHTGRQLSDDELRTRNFTNALKWWDETIAAHRAAGMKYIVTPWMPVPATLAELQTYCEYYNEIGRRCLAAGMKYGYHNHAHEYQKVEGQVMYDYMLAHTDPDLVFFQMDVYWTVIGKGSPVEYFRKYPGRFKLLHIKDHKELGDSGMVGFDAIFRNTDTAGVEHLVVEVEEYNYPPAESVKRSLDYLLACPLVKKHY